MSDLTEALRLEGDRRVSEKEMTFGNSKSREDRIADDLCHQAAHRISQQDAELDRLREALKPFALAATIFEQEYGDRMKPDTGCNIKFAVLCQARDALRTKAEETRT